MPLREGCETIMPPWNTATYLVALSPLSISLSGRLQRMDLVRTLDMSYTNNMFRYALCEPSLALPAPSGRASRYVRIYQLLAFEA